MGRPAVLSEFDPTLAPTASQPLTEADASRLMIWAIQNDRIGDAAAAILETHSTRESEALAHAALASREFIRCYNHAEHRRITTILHRHSIPATPSGGYDEKLRHVVALDIAGADLESAMAILVDDGYLPWHRYRRGAFEAFRRAYGSTTLVKDDDVAMRVELRWQSDVEHTTVSRAVRPTHEDLALTELPRTFWPLYSFIRVARLAKQRIHAPTKPARLGPLLSTPTSLIPELITLARIRETDVLFDIGSGDGRVLIAAVDQTGCRAVGIEQSLQLVARSRAAIATAGHADRIEIRHQDGATADYSDATVIFSFLPPEVSSTLIPRVLRACRPGVRVIAHEQARMTIAPQPHSSTPILGHDAITVAHRWTT